MNGSEKQIKWATDILAENRSAVERRLETLRRRVAAGDNVELSLQATEIVAPRVLAELDKLEAGMAKDVIDSKATVRYAALGRVLRTLSAEEQKIVKDWEAKARQSPSVGNNVTHIMSLLVG